MSNSKEKQKQKTDNVHVGHRRRMNKKIEEFGAKSFSTHELLEILFYATNSRKNTNELAHEALKMFGGPKGVLCASADELKSVSGIGDATANFIEVLHEFYRRATADCTGVKKLNTTDAIKNYLAEQFKIESKENLIAVLLDKNYNLITTLRLNTTNGRDYANVDISDAVFKIEKLKTRFLFLAHNHLSSQIFPSQSDVSITKRLIQRLAINGIIIRDHFVFGINGEIFSMFERGWILRWYKEITSERDFFEIKKQCGEGGMIAASGIVEGDDFLLEI